MKQREDFLARVPILAGLGRPHIVKLAGAMEEEAFKPGQAIIRQGTVGDTFYVIVDGSVSYCKRRADVIRESQESHA